MAFRYPQGLIRQLNDAQNMGIPLHRRASTNGDGTGDTNIIGDYSGAPVDFYIQPAINEIFVITHYTLILCADDSVRLDQYGSLLALPNGIQVVIQTLGIPIPIFTLIKTNRTLFHLCDKGPHTTRLLGGENLLHINLDFSGNLSKNNKLFGSLNDKFIFRVNDNFTGLCEHTLVAYGYRHFQGEPFTTL
jgi:hypothetical protein